MPGPTAVLAEDELVLRAELRQRLSELWPQLRIVGEANTGVEALELLDLHSPDLLFLDIQMPGLSGLEVAQQAQGRCHIIFVTAYDAYALAAFEVGALDYILKPIDPERLAQGLQRVRLRLGAPPANLDAVLRELLQSRAPSYLRWLNVSDGQSVRLLLVDEVEYFQADTKYTRVVTAKSETLIRKSLQELKGELDPLAFWQIHRSYIVNANSIRAVERSFRGAMEVRLKHRPELLPVAAAHAHLFRKS
ncbi:MAG TPA: LytTR family DNA-binding domain-containing protein [Steroidobacteraceae bacterium]|nr:LytTR family DNA-binding domain-containing protein [Steroidobacteraceae bacterium]